MTSEEVDPGAVDAAGVGLEPLVHLLDEPLVRAELLARVAGSSRSRRGTGLVVADRLGHVRDRLFHCDVVSSCVNAQAPSRLVPRLREGGWTRDRPSASGVFPGRSLG